MKCPHCGNIDNKVVDSRLSKECDSIRRRRECIGCNTRFTTYEQVEPPMPFVVKKDGRREPFNSGKLLTGIKKACEKRPISITVLEDTVKKIERHFYESQEKEVDVESIGERVMSELHSLDDIAYVRYASVYRSFKDIGEFIDEIRNLINK